MDNFIIQLQERLETREAERGQLKERLDLVEEEVALLRQMIGVQQRREGSSGDSAPTEAPAPSGGLREFILRNLSDGRIWTLEQLRDDAIEAGLMRDSDSPGRSMQGALIGIKRGGLIENLGGGRWRMVKNEALPDTSESAPKSTGETATSPVESREDLRLLD